MPRLAEVLRLDRRRSAHAQADARDGTGATDPASRAGWPPSRGDAEYRLVEIHAAAGWWEEETFFAPDDETAWDRVLEATTGEIVVLWCGGRLVATRPSDLEAAPSVEHVPEA